MFTITYSSKGCQNGFEDLYITVESLTDEVLNISRNFIKDIIEGFQVYHTIKDKEIHSHAEYFYELLMLGTLWRMYSNKMSKFGKKPKLLSRMFFNNEKKDSHSNYSPEYNLKNLDNLLQYLKETDEFNKELKHLQIWKEFLSFQKPQKIEEHLRNIIIFADWFKTSSKILIGNYTKNNKRFLYYLRLIGSEITSRTY